MKKCLSLACIGLTLFSTNLLAQWNNWNMPGMSSNRGYSQPYYAPQPQPQPQPFNMMPFAQPQPAMPYNRGYSQPYYAPQPQAQPQPFNMMPFAQPQPAPVYNPPPAQPFGGMMPWGSQPQPRYQAPPAQQPYMVPGMEQGIRSMMQPGRIMAEEATPGVHMQPTWR